MKNELTLNQEEILKLSEGSPEIAVAMADKALSQINSKHLPDVLNFLVWHEKAGRNLLLAIGTLQAKAKEGKK